jgi:hypothetical protein
MNLYFALTLSPTRVHMTIDISQNEEQQKWIKSIVKEAKEKGRSYASIYEDISHYNQKMQTEKYYCLSNWERIVRKAWDER